MEATEQEHQSETKKKKLLDMMKEADLEESNGKDDDRNLDNLPGPKILPFEKVDDQDFKDFLSHKGYGRTETRNETPVFTPRTMEKEERVEDVQSNRVFNAPRPMDDDDDDDDEDLGFDVDELVKKIDAKIAQLEEEERLEKEKIAKKAEQEKKVEQMKLDEAATSSVVVKKPTLSSDLPKLDPIPEIVEPKKNNIDLNEDIDDDDFFDDFFDN